MRWKDQRQPLRWASGAVGGICQVFHGANMRVTTDLAFTGKMIYFNAHFASELSAPYLQFRDFSSLLLPGVPTPPSTSLPSHSSQLGFSLPVCMSKAKTQWSCCPLWGQGGEWEEARWHAWEQISALINQLGKGGAADYRQEAPFPPILHSFEKNFYFNIPFRLY